MARNKITYEPGVPDALRTLLTPILLAVSDLIPGWVRELSVSWEHNTEEGREGAVAEMRAYREYLTADLIVYPRWLDRSAGVRVLDIVHELTHIQNTNMVDFVTELLEQTIKDETFKSWAGGEWSNRFEEATSEVSLAYTDLLRISHPYLFEPDTTAREVVSDGHGIAEAD